MAWDGEADGVFRGGGMKGLGIAGALIGFAQHGERPVRRWVNVAGASAGAIVAAYVACGHSADELADLLGNTDFRRFQDFGRGGALMGAPLNVLTRRGVVRGRAIERWLDDVFGERPLVSMQGRLKLIAVDITNRALLVFPDDLADGQGKPLWYDPRTKRDVTPDELTIARAVRMSMAMPFFFPPVELVWKPTGRTSVIVDGGTLSNFPVWLFDVAEGVPARPTFGITLTGGHGFGGGLERAMRHAPWALAEGWNILQTAMQAWDKRFVSHSTRVRTCVVDAGEVGTTDYGIDDAAKRGLIESGKRAATAFLDTFRPEEYFNTFGLPLAEAAVR